MQTYDLIVIGSGPGGQRAELLHIGQAVFALKGKITYFVNTVFNYPTLAESYKAAAFNGLNRLA
jgi:NAD(P) transhydrogenase